MAKVMTLTYSEYLKLKEVCKSLPDSIAVNQAENWYKIGLSASGSLALASILALESIAWNFQTIPKSLIILTVAVGIITLVLYFKWKNMNASNKRGKELLLEFFDHVENNSLGIFPLKILHAEYGGNGNNVDQTEEICKRVGQDGLSFTLSHGVFADHVPNVPKTLSIMYMLNGEVNTRWFVDNQLVKISV